MNTRVLAHPLVHHKLSMMRSKTTSPALFRALVEELGLLLAVEATSRLEVEPIQIDTPLEACEGMRLRGADPVLVPILRAGLGLVQPFLRLLPHAKVGHLGLARDHETLRPRVYYQNFPPGMESRPTFLLDPMLATGGSAVESLRLLKQAGCTNLTLVCVLAAPEGLQTVAEAHPDVSVVTAAIDRQLNQDGYILPGLGDAGDRIFGTL